MEAELTPFIKHLESHFGKIESGWNQIEWADPAIQIVEFRKGIIPNVTVLSTLGLSTFPLQSAASRKEIRQELFLMIKEGQLDPSLPAALDQIARESVRTNTPVLRGEVTQKEGQLLKDGGFVGFYVTLPIYYANDFWTFHDDEQGDIVFCWLLPIRENEREYLRKNGWSSFEELVDKAKFDLFDLSRPSLT